MSTKRLNQIDEDELAEAADAEARTAATQEFWDRLHAAGLPPARPEDGECPLANA